MKVEYYVLKQGYEFEITSYSAYQIMAFWNYVWDCYFAFQPDGPLKDHLLMEHARMLVLPST